MDYSMFINSKHHSFTIKYYHVETPKMKTTPVKPTDLREVLHCCPECKATGEPEDNRHKLWCSRWQKQNKCSHKFIDSKCCLKCGWVPP